MHREIFSLFTGWLEWQNWQNRIEVALLFTFIFLFLLYLRGTRGERIIRALGLVLVATLFGLVQLVSWLGLSNIEYLLDAFISALFIGLVILFQPELRRGLARIGSRSSFLSGELAESNIIDSIVRACVNFSSHRIGALIVLERRTGLKNTIESGTLLDAEASPALLSTIFYPGTALHDGAVLIRDGRLVAAGCLLPLSENTEISKALGTRHRAAVGMTEESDAVVVVVSEETGIISVAVNGQLDRKLDQDGLRERLQTLLFEAPNPADLEAPVAAAGGRA